MGQTRVDLLHLLDAAQPPQGPAPGDPARREEQEQDEAEPGTQPEPEPPPSPGTPGRPPPTHGPAPGAGGRKKRGRYTLDIRFESRGEDAGMARLVESTVLVNDEHPAWRRAEASRAEGYHLALCVAMALAPLAVEPGAAHAFITAFMGRWGDTGGKGKKKRGRGKRGR